MEQVLVETGVTTTLEVIWECVTGEDVEEAIGE